MKDRGYTVNYFGIHFEKMRRENKNVGQSIG